MAAILVVAGDLCAAGRVGTALSQNNVQRIWTDVKSVIEPADFAIVNLESPLTNTGVPILKSGPSLWGPVEAVGGIRAAGFDAVSLANNHILDAGPVGLLQTIQVCEDGGLSCVGAGPDLASAVRPLTIDLGTTRLGVLAIAENEFSTARGGYPGAWPLDLIDNAAQLEAARREHDFLVVLLHGGVEEYPLPSPLMQKRCRFFVECGADAVVCHHSHVPSGYEHHRGRPIVYGIGNFLFNCPDDPGAGWFNGYLARIEFTVGKPPELDLIPFRQDPATPTVRLLEGSERDTMLSGIARLNRVIARPDRLAAEWSDFCSSRRSHFLSVLLCLSRPESWLLDKGLLPTAAIRLTQRRLASLWNLFSCESHSESCEQFLRDMLRRPGEHHGR